jgi:hypothetical protein
MEGGIKGNKGLYEGGRWNVHCKRYNGSCTKKQVIIPKAT